MANFTKQVPVSAYRFMPEELSEWEKEYPEDILREELQTDIYRAGVGSNGNLYIKYYTNGDEGYGKYSVEVKPGEWVVSDGMEVYSDEKFKTLGFSPAE